MREPIVEAKLERCDYPYENWWRWHFMFEGVPQYGAEPHKWKAKRAAKKKYRFLHRDMMRRRASSEHTETFRIGL